MMVAHIPALEVSTELLEVDQVVKMAVRGQEFLGKEMKMEMPVIGQMGEVL